MFAAHGLPDILVSDNGTAFTSTEFMTFTKRNGIRHIRTAPYHPSSNGQVERAVQTFKKTMKKTNTGSIETMVSRFLFHCRITPHSTTGVSPAELMMGRQLKSHLSLLPDTAGRVATKQESQKRGYDERVWDRSLNIGDRVLARDFSSHAKWFTGIVHDRCGPQSFNVRLGDGRIVRRHIDHLRINGIQEGRSLDFTLGEGIEYEFPNVDSMEKRRDETQIEELLHSSADKRVNSTRSWQSGDSPSLLLYRQRFQYFSN